MDEPQHNVKGKITKQILKLLNIKYTILRSHKDLKKFEKLIRMAKKNRSIIACLIERGILKKPKEKRKKEYYKLNKETFFKKFVGKLQEKIQE